MTEVTEVPEITWREEARRLCAAEIEAQARNKAGLARMLGVPNSTFKAYLDGRRRPPASFLIDLAIELRISPRTIAEWKAQAARTSTQ